MEKKLSESYEIQTQRLGDADGWEKQGKVLNRIVTCEENVWTMEADPRRAELIVEQLGVEAARTVATPGIDGTDETDNDDDIEIEGADITRFRGVAARCNYLSFDRPDIIFATKEVCREMSRRRRGAYAGCVESVAT